MSSPPKTPKTSKRLAAQKTDKQPATEIPVQEPQGLESSPVTPQTTKGVKKGKLSGAVCKPRRRIDFSKLDIHAIASSASCVVTVTSIGALMNEIDMQCKDGKVTGSIEASLSVLCARIRPTKGGSRYVLLFDETGFVSICVSATKASTMESEQETTSTTTAIQNAFTGKINYRPSSVNTDETFMALDWNAKVEKISVNLIWNSPTRIPVSLQMLFFSMSEERNKGCFCSIIIAELVTLQVDHKSNEVTMSLTDTTGYAFINVTNAPPDLGIKREDEHNMGPVLIAGNMEFKLVSSLAVDAVAATIDFEKCFFQPVDYKVLDAHNSRISSIPKENFQFEEPFMHM